MIGIIIILYYIDDTFKLTIDVIFSPKKPAPMAAHKVDEDVIECGKESIEQK